MFLKKIKIKNLLFPIIIAAVLFLAPTHFVNANLFSLESISEGFVSKLASIFFTLIGNGITALVTLLNFVLHMAIYSDSVNAPVVYQSWTIMRDFANMFFIIALIVMAFATIFDIAKYSAKSLLAKFLIAALLINFSLTLGGLVIDGAQVFNNTFLTAIGDSALRLGQAVNPGKLLPFGETAATAGSSAMAGGTLLFNLVLGLILGGVFLVSILIATLFALIRIPMVWFLLIVSPLAWIASVFPQGDGYFKNWWKQFIGWNLFLPVFLFFLYFGIYFITNIGNLTGKIIQGYEKEQIGLAQVTFETLFAYVLSAIFLIGGLIMAFKVSFLSGTSAVKAAGWAKGTAMNTMGFTSMGKAAQMKYAQVKKEGLPGRFGQKLYGGEAGQDRRTAVWAERFGVRGVDLQRQKDFVSRADKEYENIQQQYNTGKIDAAGIASRAQQFRANDPQGYAYRKMLAKMGKLDDKSFTETVAELKDNAFASQDFIKTAKEAKFSGISNKALTDMALGTGKFENLGSGTLGSRREVWKHLSTNSRALSELDSTQFNAGLTMLGGKDSVDGKSYLEETEKVRPDFVIQNKIDDFIKKEKETNSKISEEELQKKVSSQRQTEFGKLLKGAPEITKIDAKIWSDKDFQKALTNRLSVDNQKARDNLIGSIKDSLKFDPSGKGLEKTSILEKNIIPNLSTISSTVSSRESNKSSPGIILTPGAQFEADNPEKVNIVDLRNPK